MASTDGYKGGGDVLPSKAMTEHEPAGGDESSMVRERVRAAREGINAMQAAIAVMKRHLANPAWPMTGQEVTVLDASRFSLERFVDVEGLRLLD